MKHLRNAAFAAWFLFAGGAWAQALVLPSGLALDPGDALDLTYQVVPDYDEHEKVIAGWAGEKLQYLVTVEKLPPGFLDGEKYLQLLVQDLRGRGLTVEPGRYGLHKNPAGLSVRYLEVRSRASKTEAPSLQVAQHVSDGQVAFLAMATVMGGTSPDLVLKEMRQLFQTASLGQAAPLPYVGSWAGHAAAPDGRPATATVTVNADMTFTAETRIAGQVVFRGSGFWSAPARVFTWTYEKSEPPLPPSLREDEDEIVSIDDRRWVVRSRLSGKEREFLRR